MKGKLLLAALCALIFTHARAQEITYALPSTTILVKVQVQQEQFFAGPYARYARRMLNMDVRSQDGVTSSVKSIEIQPVVEADPSALYTCEGENASLLQLSAQGLVSLPGQGKGTVAWRFPAPAQADYTNAGLTSPEKTVTTIEYHQEISEEGDTLRVPIEQKMLVDKSPEDKAAEAAETLLQIRQHRQNIASGNTDASFAGEAMAAALKELDRQEQEYLSLFRGYSVRSNYNAIFEVTPQQDLPNQRYLVFRLTEEGPVSSEGIKGVPYYMELEAEPLPGDDENADRRKGRGSMIQYRIPAICKLRLTRDGHPLLETRVPVYQFGKQSGYPIVK